MAGPFDRSKRSMADETTKWTKRQNCPGLADRGRPSTALCPRPRANNAVTEQEVLTAAAKVAPTARVHYVIKDGGKAPNVVPD